MHWVLSLQLKRQGELCIPRGNIKVVDIVSMQDINWALFTMVCIALFPYFSKGINVPDERLCIILTCRLCAKDLCNN